MRAKNLINYICRYGLLLLSAIIMFGGCASYPPPSKPTVHTAHKDIVSPAEIMPAEIMKEAIGNGTSRGKQIALPPLAELKPRVAMEKKMPYEDKLFSLSARSTPMRDVLLGLAMEADLNLIIEKGVNPNEPISLEMHDLPLITLLDSILSSYKYFYSIQANILRIKSLETKIFHFDYPLIISAPSSSVGGDMLGGDNRSDSDKSSDLTGEFTITTKMDPNDLDVWAQVEKALGADNSAQGNEKNSKPLLSPQGRIQINRMAGTIVVTDRRENLLLIEEYLAELETALRRQVIIEAKIIEVTLNEDHEYGIDWNFLAERAIGGGDLTITTDFTTGTGALKINYFNDTSGKNQISGFIDALSTQGNVNVLSSPRISVLNNQTALINVGRTIPYLDWEMEVDEDPLDSTRRIGVLVPTVQMAQSGVSLGVTPQISAQGITTLHIVPVITDLAEYRTFTWEGNTWDVPIIDVRETDTIVRAENGTTIVLGGLIQERVRDTSSTVPLLGDIPLFGRLLFSGEQRDSTKRELVILLTPTVIPR
ncbi:MAG: hypothetical protein U9O82_00220 [Thermodesulfobacteriota bacterium]|nr:hypothetical protein [Thermodesulfobacteriota bacterium]